MSITTDHDLRRMLTEARVIAVVGHSDNPMRASYQIGQYLRKAGYTVYPVNPALNEIDGQKVYPALAAVPEQIDIVDVFRRAEFLVGVVDEAIAVGARAVWGQLEVSDEAAAQKAADAGMQIVMDLCIKVEHQRLQIGQS